MNKYSKKIQSGITLAIFCTLGYLSILSLLSHKPFQNFSRAYPSIGGCGMYLSKHDSNDVHLYIQDNHSINYYLIDQDCNELLSFEHNSFNGYIRSLFKTDTSYIIVTQNTGKITSGEYFLEKNGELKKAKEENVFQFPMDEIPYGLVLNDTLSFPISLKEDSVILRKLDILLQTVFQKAFYKNHEIYDVVQSNSNLFIAGSKDSAAWIASISDSEIIWEKSFSQNLNLQFKRILPLPNNSGILFYGEKEVDSLNGEKDFFIYNVTSSGDSLNFIQHGYQNLNDYIDNITFHREQSIFASGVSTCVSDCDDSLLLWSIKINLSNASKEILHEYTIQDPSDAYSKLYTFSPRGNAVLITGSLWYEPLPLDCKVFSNTSIAGYINNGSTEKTVTFDDSGLRFITGQGGIKVLVNGRRGGY